MPSEKLVVIFTRTFRPIVYPIRYFVLASHVVSRIKGRTWTEGVWEGFAYENTWTLEEIKRRMCKTVQRVVSQFIHSSTNEGDRTKERVLPWELSWPYTTASDATETQPTTPFEQTLNFTTSQCNHNSTSDNRCNEVEYIFAKYFVQIVPY